MSSLGEIRGADHPDRQTQFQPVPAVALSSRDGIGCERHIATPLRELVGKQPNVQILLGEVTELIPDEHQIVFNGKTFSYDHLVLATGSGSSFFGQEHWRTFAPPMKILEHAEEIRRRLLMAMEQTEQTPDPEARQFLQTVVVIGSGPSGARWQAPPLGCCAGP